MKEIDERPVHFEGNAYGSRICSKEISFSLRFTRMRGDVTCRKCLKKLQEMVR